MWAFTVVVGDPLRQDPLQMPLVEWDHPIETLAPSSPNESLAVPVGLRRADGCLQHADRHRVQRIINGGRKDAVAIVHDEAIGRIDREAVPELLDRPVGCGMPSEVPVHDLPGRDVQDDENTDALKRAGHHHEEVAGQDGAGVVPKERRPGLGAGADGRPARHVASNRSRRQRETKLQPELRRDSLLALCPIGGRHVGDELLQLAGIRGRPRGRDFTCQNRRYMSRCQRTNVSGRTIVSRSRHTISRDSATRAIRDALSVRCGRT
jgi:hypothetical protein